MKELNSQFVSLLKPVAVILLAFVVVGIGAMNMIRYGSVVSSLQNESVLDKTAMGSVLAEEDSLEDFLITFNYDTHFIRPVVFEQDITAPNVLYSLTVGAGLSLGGKSQTPTITNTGVLSVNGQKGELSFEAGDNVTLTEADGKIKITSAYVDTKLTEAEVEAFVFDGESTGEFSNVQIGSIFLSDDGTSSTTSGTSLVGVYGGNLNTISGTDLQQVIESIDTNLTSVSGVSHVAVTFGGSPDYLTLTGQQITLNQIDLATDVTGTLPSNQITGAYSGITGVGTITSGTWQGTVINSAYLDSSVILSTEIDTYSELNTLVSDVVLTHNGLIDTYAELNTIVADVTLTHNGLIDTSAELAVILGDETGSGNIVFSNSPTFTGTLKLTDSSSTKLIFDSLGSPTWGNVVTSTNFAESTGVGFGIGGNSSMTAIPRFVLNADNSYVGWAMRPGDGGSLGSTHGEGNLMVRGNIGVGTSSPGALLDVQGAAQFGTGNVDLINTTGKIAAINSTYFASVDGSALTSMNASNLSSGTVPSGVVAGSYTGITGLGTVTAGTWQGTAISSTYLDTNVILSSEINSYSELNTIVSDVTLTHNGLIDTSAELAAIVTNETGTGALVFGTSPTLTTPNIGAATGTSLSVTGAITTGGVVTGTGSGLTGLNASNLSSGTVPSGVVTGSYTGITGLGTVSTGTWQGTAIATAYLNSAVILSTEIDTSAELAAIVTNETGSGALVFGTSPTLTTPNIGAATGTSLSVSGTISGNGSGLTSLNASSLGSGTVPDARLTGAYTGLTNLTGSGSSTFGSFLLSANGTAAAPAIRWSSDTNMGIYRASSDQLAFSTNGSTKMYMTSWGGVAVGDLDESWYFNPSVGNRFYVGGQTLSDSSNEHLVGIEYLNVRNDTSGFPQRALEVEVTNTGSDAPGSNIYAIWGIANNLQTNTSVPSGIHRAYGVYGEAVGNTNGSAYAYGIYCSATGADNNYCGGNQAWSNTSDARVKTNITRIDGSLDIVNSLRGVRFQRTDDGSSKYHIGFIAQEVLPYVPEAVYYDAGKDLYSMGYAELTAVLVNAVQEQHEIVLTNKSNIALANLRIDDTGEVLDVITSQNQHVISEQNSLLNQINLAKDIQAERSASTSATLETVIDRVETLEQMTNDTQAVIAGLQERISQLETLFPTQTASDAASLAGQSGAVMGIADKLDLGSLTVTGDTNLNNVGITGDITAGLLSIKGFDDELATPSAIISTLSGPLKIQDQSAGNLEIMGGRVLIDTEGDIVVRGSITVNKLNIDESDESTRSIGEGIITSGQNQITINTTSVTDTSKIFVTGKNVMSTPLVVVEKITGESFTVRIANTAESDIAFDWLIVN